MKIWYYLPTTQVLRKWNNRSKIITTPLFPRYIFVKLSSIGEYFAAADVDGVCDYIKFGNRASVISDTIVTSIHKIVNCGSELLVSTQEFKVGDAVKISSGPLCGLNAEVTHQNGKQQILIRIQLLNRNIVVDYPLCDLIRIDRPSRSNAPLVTSNRLQPKISTKISESDEKQ